VVLIVYGAKVEVGLGGNLAIRDTILYVHIGIAVRAVHQNVEADTFGTNVDGVVVVSIPKDGTLVAALGRV
jgi:hypothetical protein